MYDEVVQGIRIFPTLRDKGDWTLPFCVEYLSIKCTRILRPGTGHPPVPTGKDLRLGLFLFWRLKNGLQRTIYSNL